LQRIAFLFLAYSLIGWIWETTYVSIKSKKIVNRGFLRGPIIPIYGFAVVTIILSIDWVIPYIKSFSKFETGLTMIYIALVASVWEYVTSFGMEVLFKTRWWNYTEHRFNIKGRIALDVSIFWGIGGYVLWRFINPLVMMLFNLFNARGMSIFLSIAYLIVSIDTITTLIELINLRNVVIRLQKASEEIVDQITETLDKVGEGLDKLTETVPKLGEIISEKINDNLEDVKTIVSDVIPDSVLEQRLRFKEMIEDAKAKLKAGTLYKKYENFNIYSEFLSEMKAHNRDQNASGLTRFGEALEKAKNTRGKRFFKNYPNASTSQFGLMHILHDKLKEKQFNVMTRMDKDDKSDENK